MGFVQKGMKMDHIAETSILFDIYGGLLTEKKQRVMELYHEENLSLSEIAEEQGISRAAVFDALRSAENNLRDYESRLKIAQDYMDRQSLIKELRETLAAYVSEAEGNKEAKNKIESILSRLEE